jgi:hypothetical protein
MELPFFLGVGYLLCESRVLLFLRYLSEPLFIALNLFDVEPYLFFELPPGPLKLLYLGSDSTQLILNLF